MALNGAEPSVSPKKVTAFISSESFATSFVPESSEDPRDLLPGIEQLVSDAFKPPLSIALPDELVDTSDQVFFSLSFSLVLKIF